MQSSKKSFFSFKCKLEKGQCDGPLPVGVAAFWEMFQLVVTGLGDQHLASHKQGWPKGAATWKVISHGDPTSSWLRFRAC